MRKLAIYGRQNSNGILEIADDLLRSLQAKGFTVSLHSNLKEIPTQADEYFSSHSGLDRKTEVLLSLGGDGTILDTVTLVGDSEVPVLGINLGRLGFLSSISTDKLQKTIDQIDKKNYEIDSRCLISVNANKDIYPGQNFALNEFTIQRSDSNSMVTIHTELNGETLNSYWADGIIVATPTGSTGYSLSCGGPIIYPSAKSLILTPVSPHNLNVRPLVIPEDSVIKFKVEGRSEKYLSTLDARTQEIDDSYEVTVQKAPFNFNLVRMNDSSFVNAIREKLLWGADKRN